MRNPLISAAILAVLVSGCAQRIPERSGIAPGTPHISWIIMSGDRDNPDQEFVCQSDPRNDCVVPPSRADAPVFSDVHVYYHRAGTQTTYVGAIEIGFFRGNGPPHNANITVPKGESITNQSITGIVTDTPGEYAVRFDLAGTADSRIQPIREQIAVTVK
jgi:hypothetical protein